MTGKTMIMATLTIALATTALAQSTHHSHGAATGTATEASTLSHGGMCAEEGSMRDPLETRSHMQDAHACAMEGMGHGNTAGQGLESLDGEAFEVAFLSMMVAHHQGAIDMADWVIERGDDPKVLEAAQVIKAAQGPEIEAMTTWLRNWYQTDVDHDAAATMHTDMGSMIDAMAAGTDPDRAFLAEMIRHHQGAIDMAQVALERAEHEELRDLARDIILAQAEEVHRYRTWLVQTGE